MLPKTRARAAPTNPKKGAYSGQYGEPMSARLRGQYRGTGEVGSGRQCISGDMGGEGCECCRTSPAPPNTHDGRQSDGCRHRRGGPAPAQPDNSAG
eukprot:scaffold7825_cov128-Isochrysis_galbana.AAC.2